MSLRTTIVLADDHQVVREGFKALLSRESDFEVVGEASDGLEVVPIVEASRPDVVVLDIMMPGLNGIEVIPRLRALNLRLSIVVLSMHESEGYAVQALKSGAIAYVLKQAPAHDLVSAIREAVAGRRFLSAPLSAERIADYERRAQPADSYETLSPREREVLQLAAEGLTNAAIGERLGIGRRTVETHRANLSLKLGLKSQADLVLFAVRRGLVR